MRVALTSCASMCKHVAAALYGVGSRLDEQPELLFRLRAVDHNELVADLDTAVPLSKTAPVAGRVLETDDLSALFGLDMAEEESPTQLGGRGAAGTEAADKRQATPRQQKGCGANRKAEHVKKPPRGRRLVQRLSNTRAPNQSEQHRMPDSARAAASRVRCGILPTSMRHSIREYPKPPGSVRIAVA